MNLSFTGDPDAGPQAEPRFRPRGPGPEKPAAGEGEDAAFIGGKELRTRRVRGVQSSISSPIDDHFWKKKLVDMYDSGTALQCGLENSCKTEMFSVVFQTERNGQNKEPERSRGETYRFSLVQYGKTNLYSLKLTLVSPVAS